MLANDHVGNHVLDLVARVIDGAHRVGKMKGLAGLAEPATSF